MIQKTLRYRTRSGWVTKNDKLAAVEVDDNFIAMEEDLANTTDPAKGATLLVDFLHLLPVLLVYYLFHLLRLVRTSYLHSILPFLIAWLSLSL